MIKYNNKIKQILENENIEENIYSKFIKTGRITSCTKNGRGKNA